jgi:hypothetical protein
MHDCAYFAWAQSGSTVEHSAVGIHAIPRPAANHISQIHLTAENFMGLTTVEYFGLMIQAHLGRLLISNGLKNIFYSIRSG